MEPMQLMEGHLSLCQLTLQLLVAAAHRQPQWPLPRLVLLLPDVHPDCYVMEMVAHQALEAHVELIGFQDLLFHSCEAHGDDDGRCCNLCRSGSNEQLGPLGCK